MLAQTGMILALSLGTYIGQGVWHDSASTTHKYAIEMRIEKLPNGNIRQWFKHIFFEEGGQAIEQTLDTVPGKNGIFEMILVGTSIVGRGYCSSEACHYSLPVPSNLVEVTQFFAADGAIKRIIGSAEKNAQGNYIWWEEQISRK